MYFARFRHSNIILAILVECLLVVSAANDTLAPKHIQCPVRREWLRPASRGLSPREQAWVDGRKKAVVDALQVYLKYQEMKDFDVPKYISHLRASSGQDAPIIGMCVSGGGWASSITGSGALRAFDSRLPAAREAGTGGILQVMTYLSGLSGGAWPTLSLTVGDFPTIDKMIASWRTDINRLSGVNKDNRSAATSETMFKQVGVKLEAGFNASVAEFLGQGFAYEVVPDTEGGLTSTMSDITKLSNFKNHKMPMPILQTAGVNQDDASFFGLQLPKLSSILWEFSPFEFGTWNRPRGAFIPMEYLGTTFEYGKPANSFACVKGFDSIAFVLGAAANAFNAWYIQSKSNGTDAQFSKRTLSHLLPETTSSLSKRTPRFDNTIIDNIVEVFTQFFNFTLQQLTYTTLPNPFRGTRYTQSTLWSPDALVLVDGSETLNALPIAVLAEPARKLDFIVAWDDSEDTTYGWLNGTNMYNSKLQAQLLGIPFPRVATPTTFIRRGYTHKPVLFGCAADGKEKHEGPIVLYLANAPYSAYTNYSDFQSVLSPEQTREVMVNSFDLVTQGNGTLAQEWPSCLACAVVDRSRERVGMRRSKGCERCFREYCWDGTEEKGDTGEVDLSLALNPQLGFDKWRKNHPF